MDKFQTLQAFFSGFELKAYDENSVPENAQMPYITYDVTADDFNSPVALSASLWYRSTDWIAITQKLTDIENFMGRGGRMIAYDGGGMWIQKAQPWAQRLGDASDDLVKRFILNFQVEYIQ